MHSAEDWAEVLLPEIDRQQELGKQLVFRADAAFAKPQIYERLEERGVKYAIRLPANDSGLSWGKRRCCQSGSEQGQFAPSGSGSQILEEALWVKTLRAGKMEVQLVPFLESKRRFRLRARI